MLADLLVLGCGARLRQVPEALRRHAEAHNLAIEALDTVCIPHLLLCKFIIICSSTGTMGDEVFGQ